MSTDISEAQNVAYAGSALALVVLITRIVVSRWRREPPDLSFLFVVLSVFVIGGRVATNHYYLEYGTANDVLHDPEDFDNVDPNQIKLGSIIVLVSRVLITAVIWLQCCILLLFYSRITSGITGLAIKVTWVTLISSFIAVVLITFLECRPIELYWQTSPSPAQCIRAYAQLLVQGVSNIVIDLLLVVIAFPLIVIRKRSWSEYVRLYILFALGTFCIIITVIRLVLVFNKGSSQTTRSIWASAQIIVSTFVANAPTVYGSLRVVRRQRSQQSPTMYDNRHGPKLRPSRSEIEEWLKIDGEVLLSAMPRREFLVPLPPAAVWYDEDTAPAPHSHPLGSHPLGIRRDHSAYRHIGRTV